MNALQYTFNLLTKFHINRKTLELAFPDNNGVGLNKYTSLEERMMVKCIRPVCLTDMNILGGVDEYIDLTRCKTIELSNRVVDRNMASYIVEVPKELTGFRSIVSVYSLVNHIQGNMQTPPACMSPIIGDAVKMLGAINPSNVLQTARLQLVGENKVLIETYAANLRVGVLRVSISNNANLENIQPSYYGQAANLIISGVKAYIYNNLKYELNRGTLYAGHELPAIKEEVESFSDAKEEYEENKRIWAKVAVLNDSRKTSTMMTSMIGMMT